MNKLNSAYLQNIIDEIISNKEKYTQYYLQSFGLNQANISKIRSGRIKVDNLRLLTIKKLLNAYDYKNSNDKK